jgi:hypothetical protein
MVLGSMVLGVLALCIDMIIPTIYTSKTNRQENICKIYQTKPTTTTTTTTTTKSNNNHQSPTKTHPKNNSNNHKYQAN